MKHFWLARMIKCAVMIAVVIAAISWAVMALWNHLLPGLFGWPAITFTQALGLLILSRILFGGFHGHRGGRWHRQRRLFERWEQMTPEEREKVRAGLRNRCSRWGMHDQQ